MISQRQRDFISLLQEWVGRHWEDTEIVERGNILALRTMPSLYADGTGAVLTEVCLLEYSEEISVAQIYTTMIPTQGPGLAGLREKLPEWNFASLAGAYGIYEKQGQLYHKQNVAVLNEITVDDQVDTVFTGLCMAMDEMARRLPEALAISAGPGEASEKNDQN